MIENLRLGRVVTIPSGKAVLVTVTLLLIVPSLLRLFGLQGAAFELTKDSPGVVTSLFEQQNKIDSSGPCTDAALHWKSAEQLGTLEAYRDHLARFPSCEFATLARERITQLSVNSSTQAGCEAHPICDLNGMPPNCDNVPPGFHVVHCTGSNGTSGEQPLSAQDLKRSARYISESHFSGG